MSVEGSDRKEESKTSESGRAGLHRNGSSFNFHKKSFLVFHQEEKVSLSDSKVSENLFDSKIDSRL